MSSSFPFTPPSGPATPPSHSNVSSISQNNPNRGQRPACPRYAKDELSSDLQLLKPEFRCLINDFRDWAWANEGIENEPEYLLQLALHFKFSRHRFNKYWPTLCKFFIEKNGQLFFERDEKHRVEQIELSNKAKQFGRLGGIAKATKTSRKPPSSTPQFVENSSLATKTASLQLHSQLHSGLDPASPVPVPARQDFIPDPPPTQPTEVIPTQVEGREDGGLIKKPQNKAKNQHFVDTLTTEELQGLADRCVKLGLEPASPKLAARLKHRLTTAGIPNWIQMLEKFQDQKSAGLWDSKTIPELQAQAARGPDDSDLNETDRTINRMFREGKIGRA